MLFSIFYGIRANFVDTIEYDGKYSKTAKIFNSIYIFIFHFLGSFTGWVLLYGLVLRLESLYPSSMNQLKLVDFLLLLFAFLGLTGHLPQSMYGLVLSFSKLVESMVKKLTS